MPDSIKKRRSFPRLSHLFWIVALFVVARVCFYLLSDGFSVVKIENTFPVTAEWQLPAPSASQLHEIEEICAKPFTYLAKGSQAYAFISDDKQYVLKLFKCYHLSPVDGIKSLWLPPIIDEMIAVAIQKREKKTSDTLQSYKIASQNLYDECGLIAMEILPTPSFHQPVTLIDKMGRKHRIDLGNYGFIIQRRADLVYPQLSTWIAAGELDKAKEALNSIVALIVQRSRKGIQDSDPDLHKNAGLIGTCAVLIDLGSLHSNPHAADPKVFKSDLYKITNRLHEWLKKQSPELACYLQEQIKKSDTLTWHGIGPSDE
ncbi:MAG: hypothetical protein JSR46_08625 [Verrucomicrobia bacterium]|nr:hypothetical protein [Verrucomicrobiota bacterium]